MNRSPLPSAQRHASPTIVVIQSALSFLLFGFTAFFVVVGAAMVSQFESLETICMYFDQKWFLSICDTNLHHFTVHVCYCCFS